MMSLDELRDALFASLTSAEAWREFRLGLTAEQARRLHELLRDRACNAAGWIHAEIEEAVEAEVKERIDDAKEMLAAAIKKTTMLEAVRATYRDSEENEIMPTKAR